MNFRSRLLGLVSLVAVTAVGATAYLAFVQTSRQINESATADQATVDRLTGELTDYAREHGTWKGADGIVMEFRNRTGQRVRLITEHDSVLVDTDLVEGRPARPVTGAPARIDPVPTLVGVADVSPAELTGLIARYRSDVRLAECLTANLLGVVVKAGDYGVPRYLPAEETKLANPKEIAHCQAVAVADVPEKTESALADCGELASTPPPTPDESTVPPSESEPTDVTVGSAPSTHPTRVDAALECVQKEFRGAVEDVAPGPLRMYLGAVDEQRVALTPVPVIAAAGLVALLAVAGTVLVSRRVLRPISRLTAASERLGEGDLSRRVPVRGNDELAKLARSFNRMADSLQRGEERQRRMMADVAHELRSPLANLRGYLEALKDGVLPGDQELFANLHEEAVLQQRIVNDLQDLALAEVGALAYHVTEVDLAELLETCRAAAQTSADAAGVTLALRADEPVPTRADPDRLRQVIGNLITNALRATPPGGTVTLTATTTEPGRPTIVVHDTGAGIAPEDLPHIFDRLWRADPARGRTTGGSGLGLAIARQIITDHHGTITADSTPDAGTTITITLP